jgi:hypothetical protein
MKALTTFPPSLLNETRKSIFVLFGALRNKVDRSPFCDQLYILKGQTDLGVSLSSNKPVSNP